MEKRNFNLDSTQLQIAYLFFSVPSSLLSFIVDFDNKQERFIHLLGLQRVFTSRVSLVDKHFQSVVPNDKEDLAVADKLRKKLQSSDCDVFRFLVCWGRRRGMDEEERDRMKKKKL